MADPVVNLEGEVWKPVVGYEGLYEISNMGRVRSLDRVVAYKSRYRRRHAGKLMKLFAHRQGHLFVILYASSEPRGKWVHRLVLEAHVGRCPDGMEGCHNDGNPRNNLVSNLRWDTRSGNFADKYRHGTAPIGSRNCRAKLTEAQVSIIKKLLPTRTHVSLAAEYGVSAAAIDLIAEGRTWKHVA